MIIDPVTQTFNGHAIVSMVSASQAIWVMKDLSDMLFVVNTGPRPLQASVAMAGQTLLCFWSISISTKLFVYTIRMYVHSKGCKCA